MPLYTRTFCESLELHRHGPMGEGGLVFRDKNRHVIVDRFCRVVVLPLGQGLSCHDKADIAGLVCFEVHIHDHTPLVEGEVSPVHCTNLADAEPTLVEHHDNRTVAAPGARIHHRGHLFWGEQVRRYFGHGFGLRCFQGPDFLLRDFCVFILNEPEVELFEDDDVISDGIFLKLLASFTGS